MGESPSYHLAKSKGQRSCGSRDLVAKGLATVEMCHVTLQDHMIKESCGFKEALALCTNPARFGCRSYCGSEIQHI